MVGGGLETQGERRVGEGEKPLPPPTIPEIF